MRTTDKKPPKILIMKSDREERALAFDGERYRLIQEVVTPDDHVKKLIFEPVDEREYKQRLEKLADYLVKGSKISMKDVLISVLKTLSITDLKKMELKAKRGVKPKTKRGCIGLQFGREELFIID